MSIVSSFLHKLVKNPITQAVGKAVDAGSNFLPPGLSTIGHIGGGLLENKNLKTAAKDAAISLVGGKLMGAIGGKLGAKAGSTASDLASKFNPADLTAKMANAQGAGPSPYGGPMPNVGGKSTAGSILSGAASAGINALSGGGGSGGGYDPNANTGRVSTATQSGGGSGGGSWLDILKSPGVAEAGIGLVGSALSGYGQGKAADADRAWDKDKFGQTLGEQKDEFGKSLAEKQAEFARSQIVPEGDSAQTAQARIDSAPIRDRAMAMLSARMGAPQSSFTPHDIFNPSYGSGPAQMGGVDQNQMNAANAAYQPGQGGVTTDVQKALLKKLGYA